ncbi:MAG: hypothetical protein HQL20_08650 [Candidatus Omnitrophica bacterium]|nr:hypothetical protein [Candidatus Omnitrophota bacterium]
MKKNHTGFVLGVTAVILCSGVYAQAADPVSVRRESGEITWVDLKDGRMQLRSDMLQDKGDILEYRITENDTRVTDPADQKMLTVADLWPGQQVKVDVIEGKEEMVVQKVMLTRNKEAAWQQAFGEVKTIDAAGTLVLEERAKSDMADSRTMSYFVFEPDKLVVMQSPSRQPVQLLVKPGDTVKVDFILKDRKQLAQYVTLYAPIVKGTTTTTVVTTTQ